MMRPSRSRVALLAIAPLLFTLSCNENLPSGPDTFATAISISVPHDTLVVGDSSTARAVATDAGGRTIQSLTFDWTSADSAIVGFGTPASTPDASSGRLRTLIGRHAGRAVVTLSLPDPRFSVANTPRTETVVVGGVRILTTHDSTLTAVNDTGVAMAAGLVSSNGALVNGKSQGIRWIHIGSHASLVGTGDTIRYIARSNGVDTLIATHDFCLRSAKCADTAVVRVSQQLTMTLSSHLLHSWSFADSLAPIVTLSDRRGTGLAGTSVRLIPLAAVDSLVVKIAPPVGSGDPATGIVASPRLVSIGNDTARVRVVALAPDGATVLGVDTIVDVVRQVARRIQVEPLRAVVTVIDSIPYRALARDARGAVIHDASVGVSSAGIALGPVWIGPRAPTSTSTQGTITPSLAGDALPESNPLAPQIPVIVDPAVVALVHLDTVKAGATQVVATMTVLDSNALGAAGSFVRFHTSSGPFPDSVQVGSDGVASVSWAPPNIAGSYTLTGVAGSPPPVLPPAPPAPTDSSVRTVLQRSVVVIASDPSATKSTVAVTATSIAANGTTTVTITVKDQFGNVVTTATPADFTVTVTRGAISGTACTLGVCTATYTAPASAGADSISVTILGVQIVFSPLGLTIT